MKFVDGCEEGRIGVWSSYGFIQTSRAIGSEIARSRARAEPVTSATLPLRSKVGEFHWGGFAAFHARSSEAPDDIFLPCSAIRQKRLTSSASVEIRPRL